MNIRVYGHAKYGLTSFDRKHFENPTLSSKSAISSWGRTRRHLKEPNSLIQVLQNTQSRSGWSVICKKTMSTSYSDRDAMLLSMFWIWTARRQQMAAECFWSVETFPTERQASSTPDGMLNQRASPWSSSSRCLREYMLPSLYLFFKITNKEKKPYFVDTI